MVFRQDETNAAGSRVNITVQQGVLLTTDILPQVPVTQQDRTQAFAGLVSELLGKREIRDGVLVGFRQEWRDPTSRQGPFANVSELSSADMAVDGEFTLYIDHPYDTDPSRSVAGDEETIRRARADLALPVGFWLPQFLELRTWPIWSNWRSSSFCLAIRDSPAYPGAAVGTAEHRPTGAGTQPGLYLPAGQTDPPSFSASRTATCEAMPSASSSIRPSPLTWTPAVCARPSAGSPTRPWTRFTRITQGSKGRWKRKGFSRSLSGWCFPYVPAASPSSWTATFAHGLRRSPFLPEFGAPGVQSWSLSEDGRYLRRHELAEGANVQADGIWVALAEQFGFQDNLVDFFLLLLIRGYGFRAFAGQDPAPASELTFGKLRRLRLVKGTAVTPVQWSEAKRRVKRGWGADAIQPVCASGEHNTLKAALEANQSVAAQDDLWRALQGVARCVQRQLDAIRGHMDYLQKQLAQRGEHARRLSAVGSLNGVPLGNVSDPHDGLVALTQWSPGMVLQTRCWMASHPFRRYCWA